MTEHTHAASTPGATAATDAATSPRTPGMWLEQLDARFGSFEATALAVLEAHHLGAFDELPMTPELARATLQFADELHEAFEAVTAVESKVLDREVREQLIRQASERCDRPQPMAG